jgi:hypothetical protein
MGKKLFLTSLTFIALLFFTWPVMANDNITLNLPEKVIVQAITAMLPFDIDAHSKNIQGNITIINISQLEITNQHLACQLHLAGSNLAFLTEIAGHEIQLKVGAVEIDFNANAALRFDAGKQTLYIKPVVKNVAARGDGKNGEIGQALIALLNGREFPITMQKIDPLIAKAGAKTVTISAKIADIQAKDNLLQLQLTPTVTSKTN